jgi:hypothetical protein
MYQKYIVCLTDAERYQLKQIVSSGQARPARSGEPRSCSSPTAANRVPTGPISKSVKRSGFVR